jgi:hypothetical protein
MLSPPGAGILTSPGCFTGGIVDVVVVAIVVVVALVVGGLVTTGAAVCVPADEVSLRNTNAYAAPAPTATTTTTAMTV